MARYSAEQIYAFALAAGFDPDSATTMTAIALAESGGRNTAHATVGEDSRGLWQINARAHPDLAAQYDLYDPVQNARAAYQVSHGGADISPWTTTHGGNRATYVRFRSDAQAAAAAHGQRDGLGVWDGTDGYGHPISAGHTGADWSAGSGAANTDVGGTVIGPQGVAVAALPAQDTHGVAVAAMPEATVVEAAASGTVETAVAAVTAAGTVPGESGEGVLDSFVDHALSQQGDPYIYGATVSLSDPDPSAFDCSELTRWAASQAGAHLPDGAWPQYLYLKQHNSVMSVEQALHTRGALLFRFSDLNSGGSPTHAHVAISLGDGRTIEARGRAYGVGSFQGNGRFTVAGMIPGLTTGTGAGAAVAGPAVEPTGDGYSGSQATAVHGGALIDTDHDGLADSVEQHLGTDPYGADTDHDGLSDAFEMLYGHSNPLQATTDPAAIDVALQGIGLGTVAVAGTGASAGDADPTHIGADPGDGHTDVASTDVPTHTAIAILTGIPHPSWDPLTDHPGTAHGPASEAHATSSGLVMGGVIHPSDSADQLGGGHLGGGDAHAV